MYLKVDYSPFIFVLDSEARFDVVYSTDFLPRSPAKRRAGVWSRLDLMVWSRQLCSIASQQLARSQLPSASKCVARHRSLYTCRSLSYCTQHYSRRLCSLDTFFPRRLSSLVSTMTTSSVFPFPPGSKGAVDAPRADRVNKTLTQFGESRDDPYYWLRSDSRDDPKVC